MKNIKMISDLILYQHRLGSLCHQIPWDMMESRWKDTFARGSKDYFFVILSAAKNLSFKAAEILHSATLRSE
jgi:hypothetical protein